MNQILYCACGQPLHYTDPIKRDMVERQIASLGPDIPVRAGSRTWIVPRHYIALHGVKASDLPTLRFPELLDKAILCPYIYDTGSSRIDIEVMDHRDQFFTHLDPDDYRVRHFHVPKLIDLIKQTPSAFEIGIFELTDQQVEFVQSNHGIDETYVNERMSEAYLNEPGIICVFPDTTQLMVDGNHRFIARARRKMEHMEFWLVPESTWRKTLLRPPSAFDAVNMSTPVP